MEEFIIQLSVERSRASGWVTTVGSCAGEKHPGEEIWGLPSSASSLLVYCTLPSGFLWISVICYSMCEPPLSDLPWWWRPEAILLRCCSLQVPPSLPQGPGSWDWWRQGLKSGPPKEVRIHVQNDLVLQRYVLMMVHFLRYCLLSS